MTEYLKVKEYAKMRQISPWTVYRMVERESEEIEFERHGRTIRIVVRDTTNANQPRTWKDS